jgi:hypothetical protein
MNYIEEGYIQKYLANSIAPHKIVSVGNDNYFEEFHRHPELSLFHHP